MLSVSFKRLPGRPFVFGGAALVALLTALAPAPGSAQYFGRNKVQYESFDFRILRTPHFNIHFYPEEGAAVEDAARMSERWYERLARTFQHEFEEPKPVILYADHPDFQQTNTLGGFIGEGTGGVTESLKNRVIMPLGGAYRDTDHVLGHELVHAFQYNIAQSRRGGGLAGLGQMPLFLIEGMAEYLSVGREDPLTAMWLRDAVRRDDFPTLRQMARESRFFPYRFGQAFWSYVGGTYGDDAVIQLFRSALRMGWQPAVAQVLGVGSDTLSMEWRRAVEDQYLPLMEDRTAPGEVGTLLLAPATGAGRQNVAPSVSPDGRYVAFLSEKDLFSVDLFLADTRTGEVVRKLTSAASDPHADALRFIDSSGSWSPDGSRFVYVTFAEGDNEIVTLRVEDGEVLERYELPDAIGSISNPAWSPDGDHIAFSGQKGGILDLYLLDVETGDVEQLTFDKHADLQPAWSPDGSTLAFVSDRGAQTDFEKLVYSEPQISFLDMRSRQVSTLDLFEEGRHTNPQFTPDGRSLYFLSDQDGFADIYRVDLTTDEIRRVTNIVTGVSGITGMSPAMTVAADAGTLVFSVFDEFEFHIYALASQAGTGQLARRSLEDPSGRLLPPAEPRVTSRVGSYLSDDDTGLQPPGTYSVADSDDYDSSLQLDYLSQPSFGAGVNQFGAGVAGGAAAFFSDMLGNRQLGVAVQAQGTVKDIGGQAFYTNREKRWNWGVSAGHIPFLLLRNATVTQNGGETEFTQLLERIFVTSASGFVSYPFSRTRRIEASTSFTRYAFSVEEQRLTFNAFGQLVDRQTVDVDQFERDPLNLASGSVALVFDNSFAGFTSPVRGGRYRFEVETTVGTLDFQTLTLDWRRYFNPGSGPVTFAVRGLHFGRYGGDLENESNSALRPLFLGWENFIRGYAPESFDVNGECTPSEDADALSSCAEIDRLLGHRLGVVNLEVRLPLFGTDRFGLLNLPFLPTELVLFQDAGLAWDGERSPTFKFERTSSERIPVFSTGAGARVNVLGFLVLEAYYAVPWQRPEKGAHWGFQVLPGW